MKPRNQHLRTARVAKRHRMLATLSKIPSINHKLNPLGKYGLSFGSLMGLVRAWGSKVVKVFKWLLQKHVWQGMTGLCKGVAEAFIYKDTGIAIIPDIKEIFPECDWTEFFNRLALKGKRPFPNGWKRIGFKYPCINLFRLFEWAVLQHYEYEVEGKHGAVWKPGQPPP